MNAAWHGTDLVDAFDDQEASHSDHLQLTLLLVAQDIVFGQIKQ